METRRTRSAALQEGEKENVAQGKSLGVISRMPFMLFGPGKTKHPLQTSQPAKAEKSKRATPLKERALNSIEQLGFENREPSKDATPTKAETKSCSSPEPDVLTTQFESCDEQSPAPQKPKKSSGGEEALLLESRISSGGEEDSLLGQDSPSMGTSKQGFSSTRDDSAFGKLLCEIGRKRTYLASARHFVNSVPTWHLQRPSDKKRIQEIVEAKAETKEFMGSIFVFQFPDGKVNIHRKQACGIFDGQHRVWAMAEILKQMPVHEDFKIIVEVYSVSNDEDIKALFRELNKAEIVPEIDMPDEMATPEKLIINKACAMLEEKYPDMFKDQNCRIPNLHKGTLRDNLFDALKQSSMTVSSAKELFDMLEKCNLIMSKCKKWPQNVKRNLKKAQKNEFYLGLSKDWYHTVLIDLVIKKSPASS
mmetsp:Transcript_8701/g.15261  ORF Transcript_8701/g.15261 Transcript_8701/m.15261 type:complete len:421 (-) Transcript_8701:63-1325(-)|eukprot:CAMPEP_0184556218 /NCGR_PEP_ID=MMETSP0199_2-20130426/39570_1 /TAXON_ID=1112570 /ORGANISM="Thraustochytrium sp., Strain LLF1b" /LENGTH=420 /DNA_ID=CAMNT_0026952769 /DNA_START=174 /DNA_END=1436 /DNA_ORIENTATION=-